TSLPRANEGTVLILEPFEGVAHDPVLLDELELPDDVRVEADEVQALVAADVVRAPAAEQAMAVGHLPARLRIVGEGIARVGAANVRSHRAPIAVTIVAEPEVVRCRSRFEQ